MTKRKTTTNQTEEVQVSTLPEVFDAPKLETNDDESRPYKEIGTENVALEEVKPEVPTLPAVELTQEEKILKFLDGKKDYVKMNDFLKSLYPVPTFSAPAAWLNQAVSKTLKGLLESMVKDGLIEIANNNHGMLGKHYYEGVDAKQRHHNLTTVEIWAKI